MSTDTLEAKPETEPKPETEQKEPIVFDREYVESLRKENAKHRVKANELETKYSNYDEIVKKAQEYESMIAKQQEESGQFKELYEKTKTELNEFKGLKERVTMLEQTFIDELDSLKKGMTESDIKLLEEIPVQNVEKKLQFAKRLIGQTANTQGSDARGGSDSMTSVDAMVKEYKTATLQRKAELLEIAEKKDEGLFRALLKL